MKQGFNERNKTGKGGKPAIRSNSPKTETGGKRIGKSLPDKSAGTGKRVGKSVPHKAESFGKRKPSPARDSEAAAKLFNPFDTKKIYAKSGTNPVRETEAGNRYKSADTKKTFARPGSSPVREAEAGQRFKPTKIKKTFARLGATNISNIPKKASTSGEIRLNRFIANAGVCSRREADTFITAGMVQINGKVVTELGIKVLPTDEVRFDGNRIIAEKKVYLLLNKPKDFVTTTDDPHADKIVMDLVKDACPERIYPVGRLDRNTTGLLLFTNDGDLSKRLTHPSHQLKKIYQVSLDKPVTLEHLQQIADGIVLEDGPITADAISYISNEEKSEVGIEIHSGRNRIVRRIFEHLGYRVKKLDRVMYAGLTKKNLPRGKYRFLTEKEVGFLKMQ
jgi:23S rRNA pseudouridine2605 synthase